MGGRRPCWPGQAQRPGTRVPKGGTLEPQLPPGRPTWTSEAAKRTQGARLPERAIVEAGGRSSWTGPVLQPGEPTAHTPRFPASSLSTQPVDVCFKRGGLYPERSIARGRPELGPPGLRAEWWREDTRRKVLASAGVPILTSLLRDLLRGPSHRAAITSVSFEVTRSELKWTPCPRPPPQLCGALWVTCVWLRRPPQ